MYARTRAPTDNAHGPVYTRPPAGVTHRGRARACVLRPQARRNAPARPRANSR